MLSFESSELRNQLLKAAKFWTEGLKLDLPTKLSFLADMDSNESNVSEYEEQIIESQSELEIELPRCYENLTVTCQSFIDLTEELKTAKLYENKTCKSNKRLLVRIKPTNQAAENFIYHAIPSVEDEEGEELRNQIIESRKKISHCRKKIDELNEKKYSSYKEQLDDPERWDICNEWDSEREKEEQFFQKIKKFPQRFCLQKIFVNEIEIDCYLTQGFTIFSILIASIEEYDKYFPPILDTDLFVEIVFKKTIPESLQNNIFEAYLFELSNCLDISFEISPRPYLDQSWYNERCDEYVPDPRFRPLLLGTGTTEVLKLYNRAISSKNLDVQILFFTKVIEYVSQTVVRLQSYEAIRAKLLSQRALQPNAEFISELENIIEKQRLLKKDKESIRQTIVTCCEATELVKFAPPFIKEFKHISSESNQQDKLKALESLGKSLYSTRNEIAHAKANYIPTGDECPEEQLFQFTKCVKIASQQVIHWYYFTPESIRLA